MSYGDDIGVKRELCTCRTQLLHLKTHRIWNYCSKTCFNILTFDPDLAVIPKFKIFSSERRCTYCASSVKVVEWGELGFGIYPSSNNKESRNLKINLQHFEALVLTVIVLTIVYVLTVRFNSKLIPCFFNHTLLFSKWTVSAADALASSSIDNVYVRPVTVFGLRVIRTSQASTESKSCCLG